MARRATRYSAHLIALLLFAAPFEVSAQNLPVLDREQARLILQEISGDASYEHIRYQTQFHRPGGGSNGLWKVAEYFEAKAREHEAQETDRVRS